MFIMKWADFQDYSKWLFDILFEAKKRINIEIMCFSPEFGDS